MKDELAETRCAVGMGYSESKWVCENMLEAASSGNPGLKTTVVRVFQLCRTNGMSGALASGCWNTKEWVPVLFKASVHLGCIPLIDNVRTPLLFLSTISSFG